MDHTIVLCIFMTGIFTTIVLKIIIFKLRKLNKKYWNQCMLDEDDAVYVYFWTVYCTNLHITHFDIFV